MDQVYINHQLIILINYNSFKFHFNLLIVTTFEFTSNFNLFILFNYHFNIFLPNNELSFLKYQKINIINNFLLRFIYLKIF